MYSEARSVLRVDGLFRVLAGLVQVIEQAPPVVVIGLGHVGGMKFSTWSFKLIVFRLTNRSNMNV